jgi:hypothetical protein
MPRSMNDIVQVSVRYAFATGATALVLAIVQPSQPFLAVLATYLLVGRPFRGNDLAGCLLAAWSGATAGLVLVALFPQQFWLLLPAFAGAIVLGLWQVSRWIGPSGTLLMAMGLCATLPAGIVYPPEAVHAAWDHGANLTIGTVAAWTAFRLFAVPFASPERRELSLSQTGFVAAVAIVALCTAAVLLPSASVVLEIAAVTMALGLIQPPPHLGAKAVGALLGALGATVFDVLVAGSGNDLTVFLVALITVFAALGALVQVRRTWAPTFAQGGAMFAVAAPMLPAPELSLATMATRVEAVCAGCMVAAGLFGLLSCLASLPRAETKK